MKKVFVKVAVATFFIGALLVNVSINANKTAADTNLFGFTSEANAKCEEGTINLGTCNATETDCYAHSGGGKSCDPSQ